MQLIVVAATIPSLLLLSRRLACRFVRIAGAAFAAIVATGWIVERVLGKESRVDPAVDAIAHHATVFAASLFLVSLSCYVQDATRKRKGLIRE